MHLSGVSPSHINIIKKKKYIYNKPIYLYPIGYLNPWEITDKIFIIKKIDDQGPTLETMDSNK